MLKNKDEGTRMKEKYNQKPASNKNQPIPINFPERIC